MGNTDFACPISGGIRDAEHRVRVYDFDYWAPACLVKLFESLRLQAVIFLHLFVEASKKPLEQGVCAF